MATFITICTVIVLLILCCDPCIGTTIVGICCKNGVVLGADTRSTGGQIVMDKNKHKIRRISPRIYCCGAGVSAEADYRTRKASHLLQLENVDNELSSAPYHTLEIAHVIRSLATSAFTSNADNKNPGAVFILGGIDDWGSKMYQVGMDGVPSRISFGSLGSGSTDALAVLEKYYQRQKSYESGALNMDVDQAVKVVRQAVKAGIMNDLGSGSSIDLVVIQSNRVRQWREELFPKKN